MLLIKIPFIKCKYNNVVRDRREDRRECRMNVDNTRVLSTDILHDNFCSTNRRHIC